jgi:hypothetical protein
MHSHFIARSNNTVELLEIEEEVVMFSPCIGVISPLESEPYPRIGSRELHRRSRKLKIRWHSTACNLRCLPDDDSLSIIKLPVFKNTSGHAEHPQQRAQLENRQNNSGYNPFHNKSQG